MGLEIYNPRLSPPADLPAGMVALTPRWLYLHGDDCRGLGLKDKDRRITVLVDFEDCLLGFRTPRDGEHTLALQPSTGGRRQISIATVLRHLGVSGEQARGHHPATWTAEALIVDLSDFRAGG